MALREVKAGQPSLKNRGGGCKSHDQAHHPQGEDCAGGAPDRRPQHGGAAAGQRVRVAGKRVPMLGPEAGGDMILNHPTSPAAGPLCRRHCDRANKKIDGNHKLSLWCCVRIIPPLAAVRVFEAAARHLNFTAAGAELGMTQAAVSYQIRLLEERLGLRLFLREKGRVRLTDAGAQAAPLINSAFDRMGAAFADLRRDDGMLLTISASITVAARWLAPRLGRFQLAHPDLAVRLDSNNALVDFTRDPADVAIRFVERPADDLQADRLFAARPTPMASPAWLADHPLRTASDLLRVPRLTADDPWWLMWFQAAGLAVPDAAPQGLRLDSQATEGIVALAGQGIAMMEPRMWPQEIAQGQLVAPFPITARLQQCYWLVCPAARRNSRKLRLFRDWLLAEAEAGG